LFIRRPFPDSKLLSHLHIINLSSNFGLETEHQQIKMPESLKKWMPRLTEKGEQTNSLVLRSLAEPRVMAGRTQDSAAFASMLQYQQARLARAGNPMVSGAQASASQASNMQVSEI